MGDKDKIKLVGNKIKLVDPNDFTYKYNGGIFDDKGLGMSVPQEDLCISVELTTQSKGRTILIAENNNGNVISDKNDNLSISFINGTDDKTTGKQNNLTTKYTEVSTRLDAIDETLGITSIDIEFNSSYAPMININFVDVKGASLFQSNGDSPYNVFFRLPYPLFQLTVKGYYGKPVTYCLHMLKCNTKFNSQTGNFEITAKFVGYTYALLSDMIIGYIKAAGGTKRGKELLKQKNCPSINTFLTQISNIDALIKKQLSSDNLNAVNLSVIKTLEENVNSQEALMNSTITYLSTNGKYPVYDSANSSIVIVKDPNPTSGIDADFGDYDNFRVTVKNFQDQYNQKVVEYNKSLSDLTGLKITPNLYVHQLIITVGDLFSGTTVIRDKIKTYYGVTETPKIDQILSRLQDAAKKIQKESSTAWIKFYDFTDISDSINTTTKALADEDKNVSKQLAIELKNTLTSVLGFEPNIRNIVRIFTTHIEVFLQQVFEVSAKYKDQARVDELLKFVKNLDIKNPDKKEDLVIFPWPEYNKDNVEAYIGAKGVLANPDNVPEIKFVEELFDRMLTDEELLNDLANKADNGQQAWASVSPVDSYIYNEVKPYDRLDASATPDDIARLIGLRAMAFLGFSNSYLSPDEINAFANAEADLIITKYKENKVLIQGVKEKFSTPDSYATITGTINGTQSKLLTDNGNTWKYNYITLSVEGTDDSKVSLLPIDSGFNNSVYGFNNRSTAEYNLASSYCDTADPSFKASFVSIIEREKYDSPTSTSVIPQSNTVFNLSTLKTNTINSYNVLNQAGFAIGQGKYGVQEFTSISYAGTDYGVDTLPFFSVFYDNYSGSLTVPPAVCNIRKVASLEGWDLTNEKGQPIPFSPFPFDPTSSAYVNAANSVEKNHDLRGKNLNLFALKDNQDQIAYPFFDFASTGLLSTTVFTDVSVSTNLFGSWFYNIQGLQGRALLFLHNFPWRGLVGKTENIGLFYQPEILNIFRYRTGFVQVPKLLPAFIGGLLWRYDEGENGNDPIVFKSNGDWVLPIFNRDIIAGNLVGNNTPSHKQYMKYYLDDINIRYKDSVFPMSFCAGAGGHYANLDSALLNLPRNVKDFFIKEFNDFVSNEFNNVIRPIFEIMPKNFGGGGLDEAWQNAWNSLNASTQQDGEKVVNNISELNNNLKIDGAKFEERYKIFNYYSTKFGGYTDMRYNYMVEYLHNSDAENKLKELFFDYKYISNQSWRIWNEVAKEEVNGDNCSADIIVSKLDSFNPYINTINEKLNAYVSDGEKKKFENNELEQVKFEIYRNLKKIYDKWVAFTDKPDKILFQCCTTNGISPNRLKRDSDMNKHIADVNNFKTSDTELDLIDSFRFVTRSFRDIGDDFQINPLMVFQLLKETTNVSFYDFIGRILTQNNFDFIALPTYIDYNNDNELLSVFRPYTYYEAKNLVTQSGPSFVCVYVGQTSTKLDFNGKSQYPNDGFNLTDDVSGLPVDLTLTGKTWEDIGAAFVVKYGQQNQSVFKDVSLDQSEFGETAESLQITDTIANKLSQSNQTYVGQNLYNVFSVRSYKTEIEMMGDAMIQPMMYFQLDNIPMFRGAYLITKVKHSIVPNHMLTTFTGTRIKANETPLIDVATLYSAILNGYELPVAKAGTTLTRVQSNNYVTDYHSILVNNLPSNKVIDGSILNGTNVTNTSNAELIKFNFGKVSETEMEPTISFYWSSTKIGVYDGKSPWSGAFISYVMRSADPTFPANALHKEYVTAAMNGTAGYEVFPLKAGLKIRAQVGDILTKPRDGGYDVSHSDVIYKIENDTAYVVGGNVSNSVKQDTIKLDNGFITDNTDVNTYQLLTKKTNNRYYAGKNLSTQPVNLVVSTALVPANPSIRVNQPNVADDVLIYQEILNGIGAPITDENMKYFYAWRQAEGAKAAWNPFNTTWNSGYVTTKYNSAGVRNYVSRQDGIEATVKTINQHYYKKIKSGLVNSIGAEKIANYLDELALWGTGNGVNRVLSQNKLNPPPIARV